MTKKLLTFLAGLVVSGVSGADAGLAFMFEVNNRGKR